MVIDAPVGVALIAVAVNDEVLKAAHRTEGWEAPKRIVMKSSLNDVSFASAKD